MFPNAPIRLVVLAAFLGLSPTIRADEFKWPDSAAGRCAAAYLEAYNGGTSDQLTGFEAKYRAESKRKEKPGATWVAQVEEMRRESGPLRAKEIIDAGADHL